MTGVGAVDAIFLLLELGLLGLGSFLIFSAWRRLTPAGSRFRLVFAILFCLFVLYEASLVLDPGRQVLADFDWRKQVMVLDRDGNPVVLVAFACAFLLTWLLSGNRRLKKR